MKSLSTRLFAVVAWLAAAATAPAQGVLREVWTNLPGSSIGELVESPNFPDAPVFRTVDAAFRSQVNWRDEYGVRMRAFVRPDATGDHTFWIAGSDQCELWISPDDNPGGKVRVARVASGTSAENWTAGAEQRSAPIPLVAGRRYYIEALMKENSGGDSLAVAWATTPSGPPVVIPGSNLTPFETVAAPASALSVEAGAPVRQNAPNFRVTLAAQALDPSRPTLAATVAWTQTAGTRAVVRTADATTTDVDLPGTGTFTFRATATASGGSATASDTVTVTILPKLAPDAGQALTEYWFGVNGKTVASLTGSADYPDHPHARRAVTSLTSPVNVAERFGSRTRGCLLVPVSGDYGFFLAGDDAAEFFLSTDDKAANLRSLAVVTREQVSSGALTALGQPSGPVSMAAGRRYAFEIRHKDDTGSDASVLRWQRPGSAYAEEITAEFIAPPSDWTAALARSSEFPIGADFIIHAGRDQVLHLPRNTISLSAYEQRVFNAGDNPVRTWRKVSGPGTVTLSSPGTAQTQATFGAVGTYVLRYSVQTQRNTATDDIRIEVRPALVAGAGSFTRQVWWNRNFTTLDQLRADPAFPDHPDLTDTLPELRQSNDWGSSYATRVTGLLTVPPGGTSTVNYTFLVSGDDVAEFSISTDATPANLRRVCFTSRATGRETWTTDASQTSVPVALRPGASYFVELLHKETSGSDHFAMAWMREGDNLARVIDGSFARPTVAAAPFLAARNYYANAGRDRRYWWPHDRCTLSGTALRTGSTSNPAEVTWRKVSGPAAGISGGTTLAPEVVFSGIGTYVFELTVSEGGIAHADTVTVKIEPPQRGVRGFLTRSVWLDVSGSTVDSLRAHDPALAYPHFEELLPGTEPPADWADFHGTRLAGFLTVPVSGNYTFWVASDDSSELHLDRLDGSGPQRIALLNGFVSRREWTRNASQRSAVIPLQAGTAYPIQVLHKEQDSGDHLSVALEGPATNGREILSRGFLDPLRSAPIHNPELTVALGVDRTLLWPEKRLTLAGLVYDLKPGPGPLTYRWTGSRGVIFGSGAGPVAQVTLPGPGVHEIRLTASDGTNSGTDTLLVEVNDPLAARSGGILRQVWRDLPGSSLNDLKNSSAYASRAPDFTDVLPTFETPGNWAENYGQRLTALFSVPVAGDYVFLIASDDESELLFNSTGEDPVGAVRIARCPWAVGRQNWSSRPEQQSAAFRLEPGRRYFLQALHKEGGGDDYLAVAFRRADQTNAQATVIPGVLLSTPAGTQTRVADGAIAVEAGPDQDGVWPKARYTFRGVAVDYTEGPQALAYRWSVASAPPGAASRVRFDAPTAAETSVEVPAAGTYRLLLTVTDGEVTRSDTVELRLRAALAAGTGSILAEIYRDIPGYWVTDLTRHAKFPDAPDERFQLPVAESPRNQGDNFGLVLRGYLHAPSTGIYRFNVSADDWGEVFLGTDDRPETKSLLCFSPAGVNVYEWRRFPDYQLSRPVSLQAGRRYYLEIRLKDGGWSDHVALAWLRPGTNAFEVIDGPYLSPWKLADAAPPRITLTGDSAVTIEVGGSYVDPGFNASDGVDGDLTARVRTEGTVDVTTPGTYTLRYTVTDASGNVSTVATRTVTVALAPNVRPTYPPDTGSTPAPASWRPPATLSDLEASRFLRQATFGATEAEISRVKARGIPGWIEDQLALPASSHLEAMDKIALYQGARGQLLQAARTMSMPGSMMPVTGATLRTDDRLHAWWTIADTAPDQLRQRVAFALSEIFVVSDRSGALQNYPRGMANYYDLLVRHADGNFRDLLKDITLNPIMGMWLTMARSSKVQPDENYSREIMQLFSIGLTHLNRDGTFKRDVNGNVIPTYTQTEINELARAFTGWTFSGSTSFTWAPRTDDINPMIPFEDFHDRGRKVYLGGASLPAGQTARQDVDRVLDLLVQHPNTAPFLSTLLIKRLVTSNPSPAYVHRVASKFENNGRGVRGDLGAVVRAIFLDPEARNAPPVDRGGKLGEPVLRLTRVLRALPVPPSANPPVLGRYLLSNVTDKFNQSPLQAPTVFNFFLPNFRPQGPLQDAGLYAPEFEITTQLAVVDTANYFFDGVNSGFPVNSGPRIRVDVASLEGLWDTPDALFAWFERILLARPMSADLRANLTTVRSAYTNRNEGVRALLQVLCASPEFCVER